MKRTYKEKRKNKHIIAVIGLIFAMCIGSGMFGMSGTAATASQMNAKTPLARHGRLSVKGVDLVDQSQKKISTAWSQYAWHQLGCWLALCERSGFSYTS